VRRLLDQGADANARDELGQTPLHHAACNDHRDVAELLIRRGAVVTARDNVGRTPLYISAICGHLELNQLLIANCL
jgi:ankyrin repeat protein